MKEKLLFQFYRLLGALARRYLAKRKPIVIGINGSVGKTSCRMIITDILTKYLPDNSVYTSPKNFNGELGMSLAIFKIEKRDVGVVGMIKTLLKTIGLVFFSNEKPYDVTVLEYGIDRPLEMEFLLSICQPNISVLTKLDAVHSLQFGDPQKIAMEETKLQKGTKEICFINHDDPYGRQIADRVGIDKFFYETNECENSAIPIRYTDYTVSRQTSESKHMGLIVSSSDVTITKKQLHVTTNILGKHHHGYIAVGLAIADVVHYTLHGSDCVPASGSIDLALTLQAGRMSIFEGIHESVIIDSSYNASPLSMQAAIGDTYRIHRALFPDYKVALVLGDMRELGEREEQHHRQLAGYLSQYSDHIFLLGEATGKYTLDEAQKIGMNMDTIVHHIHFDELGRELREMLENNTNDKFLILFKGSQNTIFLEEAVKHILRNPQDADKLTRQGARWLARKSR